jgi:hypothetical protein
MHSAGRRSRIQCDTYFQFIYNSLRYFCCDIPYQIVKKSEFGSSLPIIELLPAQQVQFRCTKLGDIVEYNVKLIPKLNIIPLYSCSIIYYNIDWNISISIGRASLSQQLVASLFKFLASDLTCPLISSLTQPSYFRTMIF